MKPLNLKERLERYERAYLKKALREAQGNISEAAKLLGIKRTTMHMKLCRRGGVSNL